MLKENKWSLKMDKTQESELEKNRIDLLLVWDSSKNGEKAIPQTQFGITSEMLIVWTKNEMKLMLSKRRKKRNPFNPNSVINIKVYYSPSIFNHSGQTLISSGWVRNGWRARGDDALVVWQCEKNIHPYIICNEIYWWISGCEQV